jgi:hypothetical protein
VQYADLKEVFSPRKAEEVPRHGPQDIVLDLEDGKQPPWGPIRLLNRYD